MRKIYGSNWSSASGVRDSFERPDNEIEEESEDGDEEELFELKGVLSKVHDSCIFFRHDFRSC